MTTTTTPPSPSKLRRAKKLHPLGLGLLFAAVMIPALLSTFQVSTVESQRDDAVQVTDVVTAASANLADRTLADCRRLDRTVDPATCRQAEEVKVIVQQLPAPPRRTDAEVRQLIEDTLRANPDLLPRGQDGRTPTVDYERIVREVQARIPAPEPGKDGVSPTVDYDRVIRDVLALIPVPEDGVDGKPGEPGLNGTNGQDGKPGRGIVSGPTYVSTEDGCVSRTVYDQEPITVDVPASAVHCL